MGDFCYSQATFSRYCWNLPDLRVWLVHRQRYGATDVTCRHFTLKLGSSTGYPGLGEIAQFLGMIADN